MFLWLKVLGFPYFIKQKFSILVWKCGKVSFYKKPFILFISFLISVDHLFGWTVEVYNFSSSSDIYLRDNIDIIFSLHIAKCIILPCFSRLQIIYLVFRIIYFFVRSFQLTQFMVALFKWKHTCVA